jgi:serine/threonine protein kinase/tetratricopeptide (TPR) repeat protein
MRNEEAIDTLLLRWEESRRRGQSLSPEDLCRDCPEYREEIERRLHALLAMYDVLDTVATKVSNRESSPDLIPMLSGEAIPGYEMLGELGRGGMGIVYKARQIALNRTVALKVILAGSHAGPHHLARFRTEAEAVARLQHPNIIQIHEVGEHQGRPFLSLEYVAGSSLAALLRGTPLPAPQTARLIETLARAVHYAHQQGVIHRDLKPGNILLEGTLPPASEKGTVPFTARGQAPFPGQPALGNPKITDFGLAKQMGSAQGQTATGEVLGTPSYMAPEQAQGKTGAIGPATDVYALGAILYEGLTGRPPFRAETPMQTIHQVISQEPVPPSRLQMNLPRDLETVCLKCLEKEAAKRYPSAADLADDLRRFLECRPVVARPVGRAGRLWRWSRRNPIVAALSGLLLLVVLGSLVGLTFLWRQADAQRTLAVAEQRRSERLAADALRSQSLAQEQRRNAQAEAARANQTARVLIDMFESSDPLGLNGIPLMRARTGQTLKVRELLDRGAERVTRALNQEPRTQAKLLATLGSVYCTLGMTEKAEPLLKRALALHRRLLPKDHPDLAATLHTLGWLHHQKGNYSRAERLYRGALAIRRRHAGTDPLALSSTLFNLGWLLADMENFAAAEKRFKEVIDLRRRKLGDNHRDVAVARGGLAATYIAQGNFPAALPPYLKAMATLRRVEGTRGLAESIDYFQRGMLARELPPWARELGGLGKTNEPERCLKKSLALAQKVLGDRHPYVALVLYELARTLERANKKNEAEQCYRGSLRIARDYGLDHPKVTILVCNFCVFLQHRGKGDEARQLLQEALKARRERYGRNHPLVVDLLLTSGDLLDQPSERTQREQVLREALSISRHASGPFRRRLPVCLTKLARVLDKTRAGEAERLLEEALPLARKDYGKRHELVALILCDLGAVHIVQGKFEKGESVLREALALSRKLGSPRIQNAAWRSLGRLYRATGQPAKAGAVALERRRSPGLLPEELVEVAGELGWCAAQFSKGHPEQTRYADLALETLRRARARGFKGVNQLQKDPNLRVLKDRPEFKKLVQSPGNEKP